MAEVYQLKLKNKDKTPQLDFVYIPVKQQSDAALAIVKATGTKIEMFPGTPVFVARAGDKGLLTIQQGNESAIPMFFDKEQLQSFIEKFKTSQPDLAKSADIQVLQLESILDAMGSTQKDESIEKIMLIPSNEALQFLQSLQPPAAAPKK